MTATVDIITKTKKKCIGANKSVVVKSDTSAVSDVKVVDEPSRSAKSDKKFECVLWKWR
jgi:HlyD family secretion protein